MLWQSGCLALSNRPMCRYLLPGLLLVSLAHAQEPGTPKPTTPKAATSTVATTALAPITIVRKPGHEDGEAQIPGEKKDKVRKIAPHALAAWRVRGDVGALVVTLKPAKGQLPKQYVLHY